MIGEPIHGCMNFTNGHELVGRILIVERGMCSFITKVNCVVAFDLNEFKSVIQWQMIESRITSKCI